MKRRHWFLLTAAVVAFVVIACFADTMVLEVLGPVALVWIGLPAALVSVFRRLFLNDSPQLRRHWQNVLYGVGVCAGLLGLAIPINRYVHELGVDEAKEYPAQVAPLLEAYRKAHGFYPKSLDQLPSKPPVPRLLSPHSYHSYRDFYRFSFPKPGGMFEGWMYDSRNRTWWLST
ncbi:hypothetical protein [Roseimicrobium sp. ORNL1]|uniref:hypothetical protein n=1 Tax=Roseimicrobium sp. ORNL1 TaxID=2711231 RepID=UPI0013E19DD0|nr:hypothetical protein [Roseimicrobium sp. ORNL1]QIF00973.1 hypothetical protein G5S37_05390 [Roseimicrobium sp. ORNL1]